MKRYLKKLQSYLLMPKTCYLNAYAGLLIFVCSPFKSARTQPSGLKPRCASCLLVLWVRI
jgi:hypothetical protein